ncbi:hypothetical protein CGRA01v4_15021 [Colletotrichum graminicola]|nr:hypothetical protein CGRA01v4_15021 [Colletotrichum graminicola]
MYGGRREGHMWTLVRLLFPGWPRGEKTHDKFVYGLDRLADRLAGWLAGWLAVGGGLTRHGGFDQALNDADIAKNGSEPPCMVACLGTMLRRRTGAARC